MNCRSVVVLGCALLGGACAGEDTMDLDGGYVDAGTVRDGGMRDTSRLPFAREVADFAPGAGAGYGRDALPSVVVGPPMSSGTSAGSLDVVSLGVGGTIVLGFGSHMIVDGPGTDFVVFENSFYVNGDEGTVFAELGEVSVSTDAMSWHTFDCDAAPSSPPWTGCAGWRPTRSFDPFDVPLDPTVTGGDPFDLATVGVRSARFVRIRDLSDDGIAPTAGFDLDAIGIVHADEVP